MKEIISCQELRCDKGGRFMKNKDQKNPFDNQEETTEILKKENFTNRKTHHIHEGQEMQRKVSGNLFDKFEYNKDKGVIIESNKDRKLWLNTMAHFLKRHGACNKDSSYIGDINSLQISLLKQHLKNHEKKMSYSP